MQRSVRLSLLTLVMGLAIGGCAGDKPAAASTATAAPATSTPAGDADLLATIGTDRITVADLDGRTRDRVAQLDAQYQRNRYRVLQAGLDEELRRRLLDAEAKKQGKSVDELLLAEAGGSFEPSDVEIGTWYQNNAARLGGRPLESVRTQIADQLRNDRRREASEKIMTRLYEANDVTIALEPTRVQIDTEGAPSAGPADAKVTLVEFSDFQCPFCGRFAPTLSQVKANYGDKVRIVYKQYPIASLHADAVKAAEASLCANEQGKFWDLHDTMFRQQDRLAIRDLKETAGRLGMDQKKFDACLDSGRYSERVQNELAEGIRLGVTGTPHIFINGATLEGGAVSYEVVAKALDQELARAK